MLILKDDHKQHLELLISQTPQVTGDLCKLAGDYLVKGPNVKVYQIAANKLECTPEAIRNVVEGLAFLLVESCKLQVDEPDFRDYLLALGLQDDCQESVSEFYRINKLQIREALGRFSLDLPQYENLEWRFDVQVSSRSLERQVTPLVTLQLTLNNEVVTLQTDPTNLVQLTRTLEDALNEASSQHTRQIQRSFNSQQH